MKNTQTKMNEAEADGYAANATAIYMAAEAAYAKAAEDAYAKAVHAAEAHAAYIDAVAAKANTSALDNDDSVL